jgi:hypothetical protein
LISRRAAIRAIVAAPVAGMVNSALAIEYNDHKLTPRLDGEYLRVSAPNFKFLRDRSLQRLRDGASVAFVAQLTVSGSPTYVIPDARSVARFAVSYDIWEERFSVTRITDRPDQKLTKSHQLAPAAESWCLESLVINRAELPADRPFYLRLDLRVEDPRDQAGVIGESGINIVSISRWVEVFSRPVRDKQDRFAPWTAGPLRLEDLRGSRG